MAAPDWEGFVKEMFQPERCTFRCTCGKWEMLGPIGIDYAEDGFEMHIWNTEGASRLDPAHKLIRPAVYEERDW